MELSLEALRAQVESYHMVHDIPALRDTALYLIRRLERVSKVNPNKALRIERNSQRELINELIRRVMGNSEYGGCPGSTLYLKVEDHEVPMLLVSTEELADWLDRARPGYGSLDLVKKNGEEHWVAGCDMHGEVARGECTVDGHNSAVRAWYAHDRDYHGGDGHVPPNQLIGEERRRAYAQLRGEK